MKKINKKILFILTAIVVISFFCVLIVNAETSNSAYVAKTYIDYPTNSAIGGNITVEGWVMTNDSNSKIKAYIDDKEVEILSTTRSNRPDVLTQIKGYGTEEQNKQPGIKLTLNCNNLSTGTHKVSIKVISRENKVISEFHENFIYENEKSLIWVDTQLDTNTPISGNYKISGWIMSNDAKSNVKIYINNQEQSQNSITRKERNDVIQQIKGYGSKKENPKPGFEYTINCSNYTDGTYQFKMVALSEDGKTIGQYVKDFTIQKYKAKTWVDYPANNYVGGNITVEGWVMTNDTESKIKAYIDNKEVEILSTTRSNRPDVLTQVKGYGTEEQNKQPGIKLILNCANLSKGTHKISLKVISRENKVIAENQQSFTYQEESAQIYVDTPLDTNNIISNNYKLEGWVMANVPDTQIKVLIDNQEQSQNQLKRVDRKDVLEKVTDCGSKIENPQPGFYYIINNTNIKDGTHTLKIQVLSKEGKILTEYTKNIVVEKYKAKTWIDYPVNSLAGVFELEGWLVSNDEKSTYKIYIDNVEQKNLEFTRNKRDDVLTAYKEYNTEFNKQPGIKCKIDGNNLSNGKHNITLKVFSREGKEIASNTSSFIIEDSKASIYIDAPSENFDTLKKDLKAEGWIMSNDKNISIKTYIDGIEQNITNLTRIERTDVLEKVEDYGSKNETPKPGFMFNLDMTKIPNGEHTIRIDVLSSEGKVITSQSRRFFLDRYETLVTIDKPILNQEISTSFKLSGWVMSTGTNSSVKVYIDDKLMEDVKITRKERPDVILAIKDYGTMKENPTPGFEAEIDTTKITDGKHTLKIKAFINNEETKAIATTTINIKKYKTSTYIDKPDCSSTRDNSLTISGWVMSELANKKVLVKIDGKDVGNVQYNTRPDVIEEIKGYGTIKENPTPGFSTTVDLNNYGKGTHKITIQVYSNDTNEVIYEQSQNIVYLGKIERETITYGYSGAYLHGVSGGSELICYKYGDGPNVLFATFCVHGFEDSWDRDGEILVKTANDFYDRLIQEQDYSLAEKWTIYIFPEVNPDGRRLGTTKNGPGRTTLYSMVGKGIDINRSWQTGSSYERFTSDRNYNGTEGFQAYEARYLRDFILSHKTNNGQNVLIDFHGWENQLIGDESICKYYKEQYPSCRTTGYGRYGSQYIISWARLNIGAKVALVELPLANSMAEALSMKLPEKYITATLNYLRAF